MSAALRTLVRRELRDPLLRTGYALITTTVVNAGVGIAFWLVAARLLPASAVGNDAALLAVIVGLSGVAQLSLLANLPRLLPLRGDRVGRTVLAVYLVTGTLTSGLVALFWTIGRAAGWALVRPVSGASAVGLVLGAGVWTVFQLQDSVLVSLRLGDVIPVENIGWAVMKLAALVVFARAGLAHAALFAWMLPVVPLVIAVNRYAWARFDRLGTATDGRLATRRSLLTYVGWEYVALVLASACLVVGPVLVVTLGGAAENAAFYLAFTVATAIDGLAYGMFASFTAEAARDGSSAAMLLRRALSRVGLFLGAAVVAVVLVAPIVMRALGEHYARRGAAPLQLLALACLPRAVVLAAAAVNRVDVRPRRTVVIYIALVVAVVASLLVSMADHATATRAAAGWLIAHVVVAAGVLVDGRRRR